MALTRDFKETVRTRIATDPAFRMALLREGVECLLSGDPETGRAILRDYINQSLDALPLARGAPRAADCEPGRSLPGPARRR